MLRPLRDHIIVRHDPFIPHELFMLPDVKMRWESQQQIGRRGVVMAVGPGLYNRKGDRLFPLDVKVGDIVRYGEFEYPIIDDDDWGKVTVLQEADVCGCVVDPNDNSDLL